MDRKKKRKIFFEKLKEFKGPFEWQLSHYWGSRRKERSGKLIRGKKWLKNSLPVEGSYSGLRSTEFQIRKTHRPTPKHIKIKMPTIKDNERPLKVARQKKVIMFKETCIRVLLTS